MVGDLTNADDSTPPAPADIVKREDGDWEVRGTADLSEVQQELDVELPTEDCDTFGGLVFAELGTIPEDGTTCDKCGAELTLRADDKPEVVKHRLDIYHGETEPLIGYYKEKELLVSVDGRMEPAEVTAHVKKVLGI